MSIRPGMIVLPARSKTRALAGAFTRPRGPIAAMRPFSTRMSPRSMMPCGPIVMMRALRSRTWPGDSVARGRLSAIEVCCGTRVVSRAAIRA
jgi:hypothetical protein